MFLTTLVQKIKFPKLNSKRVQVGHVFLFFKKTKKNGVHLTFPPWENLSANKSKRKQTNVPEKKNGKKTNEPQKSHSIFPSVK